MQRKTSNLFKADSTILRMTLFEDISEQGYKTSQQLGGAYQHANTIQPVQLASDKLTYGSNMFFCWRFILEKKKSLLAQSDTEKN